MYTTKKHSPLAKDLTGLISHKKFKKNNKINMQTNFNKGGGKEGGGKKTDLSFFFFLFSSFFFLFSFFFFLFSLFSCSNFLRPPLHFWWKDKKYLINSYNYTIVPHPIRCLGAIGSASDSRKLFRNFPKVRCSSHLGARVSFFSSC